MLPADQFRAFEATARQDAEDYRAMAEATPAHADRFERYAANRDADADWYARKAFEEEWLDERQDERSAA